MHIYIKKLQKYYKMGTLVYGTYEEIEEWCEKNDMWVDKYLDHVNPSTIYNTRMGWYWNIKSI